MNSLIGRKVNLSHAIGTKPDEDDITWDYLDPQITGIVTYVDGNVVRGYMGKDENTSMKFNISLKQIKTLNKELFRELKIEDLGI